MIIDLPVRFVLQKRETPDADGLDVFKTGILIGDQFSEIGALVHNPLDDKLSNEQKIASQMYVSGLRDMWLAMAPNSFKRVADAVVDQDNNVIIFL